MYLWEVVWWWMRSAVHGRVVVGCTRRSGFGHRATGVLWQVPSEAALGAERPNARPLAARATPPETLGDVHAPDISALQGGGRDLWAANRRFCTSPWSPCLPVGTHTKRNQKETGDNTRAFLRTTEEATAANFCGLKIGCESKGSVGRRQGSAGKHQGSEAVGGHRGVDQRPAAAMRHIAGA